MRLHGGPDPMLRTPGATPAIQYTTAATSAGSVLSPSTLPQGTVNMNQCTDVVDAEPKTGQKNALCIVTPEREFFIRGESKEIIN
eukprot:g27150.t1